MASNQKDYRKLSRSGSGSSYVVLPADLVGRLGWREHQKLSVTRRGKTVVIRDWEP